MPLAAAAALPAVWPQQAAAHPKPGHPDHPGHGPLAFTPIDRGDVPTGPILQAMRDVGFAGWVCTELDSWRDPAEGARLSMDYLNRAIAG